MKKLKIKKVKCGCSCHRLKELGWPETAIKKHNCCSEMVKPEKNKD